uniref:Uncharacterized protein n=1 Tax=Romanomermis culicivorax TaxID=13658 RepID=A0A915HWI0_ROMCU
MASSQRNFISPTATPRDGSPTGRSFRIRVSRNGSPTVTDSRRTATNDVKKARKAIWGPLGTFPQDAASKLIRKYTDKGTKSAMNEIYYHRHHHHPSQSNGSNSASNRENDGQSFAADDGYDGEGQSFPPPVNDQQQPVPQAIVIQQPAQKHVQAAQNNDGGFFVKVDVEFWRKFARVMAVLVGIVFVLLSFIACVIGFNAMNQCPASPFIPVSLCGGGITCLIFAISIIIGELCSWRVNFSAFKILTIVLVAFMTFWLIGGSIASFNSKITTEPLLPYSYRSRYCDKTAYEFSIFILCFIHINLVALFVVLIVCAFVVSERITQKMVGFPLLVITYVSPNFRRLWDEN